jgi:hypothetical protein
MSSNLMNGSPELWSPVELPAASGALHEASTPLGCCAGVTTVLLKDSLGFEQYRR